jgi:endonuclease/exonuclease/phosphatase (EEP) superfamily protein YafD
VVIEEIDKQWLAQLETLQPYYPYIKSVPRQDNFGIAVLSRIPFKQTWTYEFIRGRPSISAEYELEGRRFSLIGTHPPPPKDEYFAEMRNSQFVSLAELVNAQPDLAMVLGDLNCTSGSPYFKDLLYETGLKDSRRGFGNQPTWPTKFFPGLIAIDHCLASEDIIVTNRKVGQYVGSDHYPVIVDFAIAPSDWIAE